MRSTRAAKRARVEAPEPPEAAAAAGAEAPAGAANPKLERQDVVERHYRLMRTHQTMEHHARMVAKWTSFDHAQLTVREAFARLDHYVDSSFPDSQMSQLQHMLQTAESIRAAGHPDWFQLVGLVHDLGKIMFVWGEARDGQDGSATGPQWSLGGDTWVVGCRLPDSCVFPELNALNPDMADERYNTRFGAYEPRCGLAALRLAWGHDEYLYRVLVHNGTSIPEEGLAMVRYHSCYPWHTHNEYAHLTTDEDELLKDWVLCFNQFDRYTHPEKPPDVEALWPYYQTLIDKYLPERLSF